MKALKTLIAVSLFIGMMLCTHHTDSCGIYVTTGDFSRVSLFQPDINSPRNMFPFFFSSNYYYSTDLYATANYSYDYGFMGEENDNDSKLYAQESVRITNDWYVHLRGKASKADISYVLFDSDIDRFFFELDSLKKQNSFLTVLQKPQYAGEYKYVLFAKDLELRSNTGDPWACADCPDVAENGLVTWRKDESYYSENSGFAKMSYQGKAAVTKIATAGLAATDNEFLKRRYALLLARIYFYNEQPAELNKIYTEWFDALDDDNYLKCYVLLYVAQTKSQPEYNYLLSKVFAHCPEKQYRAQELFATRLGTQTLALAKTNSEKATILAMSVLQNPGNCMSTLRLMATLDPANRFLPIVLVREINKMEDIKLGSEYSDFGPVARPDEEDFSSTTDATEKDLKRFARQIAINDARHSSELYNLLNQLSTSSRNTDLYHLGAGYVAYLNREFNKAAAHYNLVNATTSSGLIRTQLSLNRLVLDIAQSPGITPEIETRICDYLDMLDRHRNAFLFPEYMRTQFLFFTGKLFIEKNEIAKGIMLLAHSRQVYAVQEPFYEKNAYHLLFDLADAEQINQVMAILGKKEKSPFEKVLAAPGLQYVQHYDEGNYGYDFYNDRQHDSLYPWDKNRIMDLKCMYYMRHNNLAEAYKAACLIDDAYWKQYPYGLFIKDDPFWVNPSIQHDPFNTGGLRYNKRTILAKAMKLMKSLSRTSGDQKALACFQLGNFYFSSGYYGKYWIMKNIFAYNSFGEYEDDYLKKHKEFFNLQTARNYYIEASKTAISPDLKAMATYFAWICANKTKNHAENPYINLIRENKSAMSFHENYTNCMLIPDFFNKYKMR